MPAPTRQQQRRWRATANPSITLHLDALDTATLDAIAIQLYYRYPHYGVLTQVRPSRPEAIRALCAAWRAENGRPPAALIELRGELADFWRAETSWRQTAEDTTAKAPATPWPYSVRRSLMALVQLVLPW